jgi:hypothetical protein
MKKYFTKYLPVEGEIKEGDYIQVPHALGAVGKVIKIKQGKEESIYHYGERNFCIASHCHRVKLFLCSRDIQVGDDVWDSGNGYYKADQMLVDLLTGPAVAALKEVPVKVIGEISPHATWVTEGMEFDEDEVKTLYDRRFLPIDHWLPNAIKRIVAVVGPCGHFH